MFNKNLEKLFFVTLILLTVLKHFVCYAHYPLLLSTVIGHLLWGGFSDLVHSDCTPGYAPAIDTKRKIPEPLI